MPHRKAATLSALIAGSAKVAHSERQTIISELQEVYKIRNIMPQDRRNFFQIIHALRGYETAMGEIVRHHHLPVSPLTMGGCLYAFRNKPTLPFTDTHRQYYQSRLVNRRNALMHRAGQYPTGRDEVIRLIDLMSGCLSRVL